MREVLFAMYTWCSRFESGSSLWMLVRDVDWVMMCMIEAVVMISIKCFFYVFPKH